MEKIPSPGKIKYDIKKKTSSGQISMHNRLKIDKRQSKRQLQKAKKKSNRKNAKYREGIK